MAKRELQFDDGKSRKFWTIVLKGKSHSVTFGRTGTNGQTRTKEFDTQQDAKKSYDRLVEQKLGKGYAEAKKKGEASGRKGVKTGAKKVVKKGKPAGKKVWYRPKLKFSDKGPSVTAKDLDSYPVELTEEHRQLLMWANGGVPEKQHFRKFDEEVGESISCLDFLYGVYKPRAKRRHPDVADAILQYRDHLPRWSIPLGRIDDDCFLLTFWAGERQGKVWEFLWFHDDFHENRDPNASSALVFLADSISEFLSALRDSEDFWTEESFAIDESRLNLKELKSRLRKLGCRKICGDTRSALGSWAWEPMGGRTSIETELVVAGNGSDAAFWTVDVGVPEIESRDEGELLLHVKVSCSLRDECIEKLQRGLGEAAVLVSTREKG